MEEYKILETKGKESVRALHQGARSQTALNAEKFKRGCGVREKFPEGKLVVPRRMQAGGGFRS